MLVGKSGWVADPNGHRMLELTCRGSGGAGAVADASLAKVGFLLTLGLFEIGVANDPVLAAEAPVVWGLKAGMAGPNTSSNDLSL